MARVRATEDIIRTWLASVHETGRPHYESGRRLSADGWKISSGFGAGSDLAEYLPAGRNGRSRALFLVTGDTFGTVPFHSSIQTIVRWQVSNYVHRFPEGDVDILLIPFSALLGAGIDRSTIRPLEIRPDRTTETEHGLPEALDLDNLATASRTEETGYSSRSEVFTWRLGTGARIVRSRLLEMWRHGYRDVSGAECTYSDPGAVSARFVSTVQPDGQPFELGAPRYYRDGRTSWTDEVRLRDGRWFRIERRHWLGDSVFTATVDGRRARRRPVSVRDVLAAANLQVANETALRTAGYGHEYRADPSRAPSYVRRLFERPLDELDVTAPIVETVPYRARRRFISSFDNVDRNLYYLATLPYSSRAQTVADAEMDLAPAAVHAAIARGRDVRRQGDMFYIGTSITDADLDAITVSRARLGQWLNGTAPKRGAVGHVAPITAGEWTRRRRYRRRWFRDHYGYGTAGPRTAPGTRRDVRKRRAELRHLIATYRLRLRALTFGATAGRLYRGYEYWTRTKPGRTSLASALADTRRRLESAETQLAELERKRTASRDEYRTSGHTGYVRPVGATDLAFTRGYAVSLWTYSATAVADVFDKRRRTSRAGFEEYRRRLQRALQVHGTGHTATEVVHATAGRVYVRGTVRHVPALVGENRAPDHRTFRLGDGRRWYLAVRNTVPRNRDVDSNGRRRG